MGRVRTGKKRSEAWGERTLECEYREEWGSTPAPDTALSFVVLIARPEHIGGESAKRQRPPMKTNQQ